MIYVNLWRIIYKIIYKIHPVSIFSVIFIPNIHFITNLYDGQKTWVIMRMGYG